jgi:HKD family nuclease
MHHITELCLVNIYVYDLWEMEAPVARTFITALHRTDRLILFQLVDLKHRKIRVNIRTSEYEQQTILTKAP